ncbi:hypothetical protein, partial [Klebsiella pneumoniae]|uniref:hypothetical protein n=1 Tax=Klebsiella pneumoniae TaxID=573 RepID=UPI003F7D1575
LHRRKVLHTQGEAGLKRVVKKEHADGSVTHSQYDAAGRLKAQTDAAGRTTEYSPDVVKRCAASAVMNSPPLIPLPGSYRAST